MRKLSDEDDEEDEEAVQKIVMWWKPWCFFQCFVCECCHLVPKRVSSQCLALTYLEVIPIYMKMLHEYYSHIYIYSWFVWSYSYCRQLLWFIFIIYAVCCVVLFSHGSELNESVCPGLFQNNRNYFQLVIDVNTHLNPDKSLGGFNINGCSWNMINMQALQNLLVFVLFFHFVFWHFGNDISREWRRWEMKRRGLEALHSMRTSSAGASGLGLLRRDSVEFFFQHKSSLHN